MSLLGGKKEQVWRLVNRGLLRADLWTRRPPVYQRFWVTDLRSDLLCNSTLMNSYVLTHTNLGNVFHSSTWSSTDQCLVSFINHPSGSSSVCLADHQTLSNWTGGVAFWKMVLIMWNSVIKLNNYIENDSSWATYE